MPDLTLVSLFDGVGGFPLALQRCGVELKATVEIDRAAAAVSARHFPGAAQFSDVKEVGGDELRAAGFVPDRGILTAGWPCQDNSVAGRRAGLDGARSGLWWEVVRLLDETRPRWFIGENVPGLLSVNNGRDFGAVLGSLGELGYGYAYRVLDAKYFGVPQQRRRVFIVGHHGAPWGAPAQVLFEPESSKRDSAPSGQARQGAPRRSPSGSRAAGIAPALVSRYAKGTDSDATDALIVSTLQGGGKRGYRIDAESAAGNHLVVSVAGHHSHTLTAEGADASEDGTGRGTPIVSYQPDIAATLTSGRSASPGVNPPGRRQEDDSNLVAVDTVVRRLTPLECERLQGYPDKWAEGQSDAQIYRQMGNSLAVPVVEWIGRGVVAVDARLVAA